MAHLAEGQSLKEVSEIPSGNSRTNNVSWTRFKINDRNCINLILSVIFRNVILGMVNGPSLPSRGYGSCFETETSHRDRFFVVFLISSKKYSEGSFDWSTSTYIVHVIYYLHCNILLFQYCILRGIQIRNEQIKIIRIL